MTKWLLCGLIIHLSNKVLDYDQRAVKAKKKFCSFYFLDTLYFLRLLELFYPVQHLVVDKLKEGNLQEKKVEK